MIILPYSTVALQKSSPFKKWMTFLYVSLSLDGANKYLIVILFPCIATNILHLYCCAVELVKHFSPLFTNSIIVKPIQINPKIGKLGWFLVVKKSNYL